MPAALWHRLPPVFKPEPQRRHSTGSLGSTPSSAALRPCIPSTSLAGAVKRIQLYDGKEHA